MVPADSTDEPDVLSPGLVLVVDDNPVNLDLMEQELTEHGYAVRTCANPAKVQALAAADPVDVIVLDIQMPGMDGYMVCEALKAAAATADIPVVFLTATHPDPARIIRGLDLGANDYLTKPVETGMLLARVRTQVRIKRLQDALKSSVQRIQQLEQLRTDLVTMIAHDLKNPVSAILGVTNLLLAEGLGPLSSTEQERALESVQQSSERLLDLVHDMLTVARSETGRLTPQCESLDVLSTLAELAYQMSAVAEEHDVRLLPRFPEQCPPLRADPQLLCRAVENLITNALKYAPTGGAVRLAVSLEPGTLVITVEDNGPGIPAEDLPHLFDLYYRVRQPGTRKEGLGLGLAVVKAVADAHGGTVNVASRPGEGTTFTVRLPFAGP